MDSRVKFYCWLISLLERRRMTFAEIADAWADASVNAGREPLPLRTFHRYRQAIEAQFGVSVECGGRSDGYRYYIKKDPVDCDEVMEWMLSSLRLASLGEALRYHNKVMLDRPPLHTEYLDDILGAIDKQYQLRFTYTTPYGEVERMTLAPAFVRYYNKRWYVIGVRDGKGAPARAGRVADADERRLVRCLPFDRMDDMRVVCQRHPLSLAMRRFLTPGSYYAGCYGVMRMEEEPPLCIRIRAFYPEYNYLEEVPLHESQRRVAESPDGMSREYTLTVRLSRDFLQELLWHGRNLVVLAPESLRRKMEGILRDMLRSYHTGECTNGE